MTIFFPDLSHYKTPSLNGAVALITKATQGTSFVDSTYASFQQDASRRGIPFAGYHWVDASDLAAQAANAYRIMGGTPCMWDAEATGATVPRLVAITKRYRELGGNPRMVYLPHWWWQDHLGSPSLQPLDDLGLLLVSSSYPAAGYTENGPGWIGYGGMTPTIWQYTDAQLFNGVYCDFNAFKGTVDQLRRLWGLPATPEVDDMRQMLVRFADDPLQPAQLWLADGQFRRRVQTVWWSNGTGPITNVQAHQTGLLGNLVTGPAGSGQPGTWDKTGTIFTSGGDQDVWGVDIATLAGGSGGGLTFDQAVEAARQGAEKAEDS